MGQECLALAWAIRTGSGSQSANCFSDFLNARYAAL